MRKSILLWLPVLILALLSGCTKPVALQGINRIAVLTPDNYTTCPELSADIKRELLELIPKGLAVEVIDGAAIEAELPLNGIEAALEQPGKLEALGKRYGIDALIVGAATEYLEKRDGELNISWIIGHDLDADIKMEISVAVGFNLRLRRVKDGGSVLYRQSSAAKATELAFGLGHPYISFNVSAEPRYKQLREEAVHDAVAKLLKQIREEAAK